MTTTEYPDALGSDSTSRNLLEGAQSNNPTAWDALVELYGPLVFLWCRNQGMLPQDMDDVFQEVFRSVSRNIGSFEYRKPSDSFRGWLRTITRNKIADHYRREAKQRRGRGGTSASLRLSGVADIDDELSGDERELQAERGALLQTLALIRSDVSPQTWNLFWQIVVNGKDATQVANELGMRPGTVRVAKSRVLKRLRDQLRNQSNPFFESSKDIFDSDSSSS